MKRGLECAVHFHRTAVPQEDHHIWPKQYHGPDAPDNLVRVCANGHGDIHYYLQILLKTGGKVSPSILSQFSVKVRKIATQGFVAVMNYAEEQSRDLPRP